MSVSVPRRTLHWANAKPCWGIYRCTMNIWCAAALTDRHIKLPSDVWCKLKQSDQAATVLAAKVDATASTLAAHCLPLSVAPSMESI